MDLPETCWISLDIFSEGNASDFVRARKVKKSIFYVRNFFSRSVRSGIY